MLLIARQCNRSGLADPARPQLGIAVEAHAGGARQSRKLRWSEALLPWIGAKFATRPYDTLVGVRRWRSGSRRSSVCCGAEFHRYCLAMRARAHTLVWGHAQRAGLPASHPDDVARFGQTLFLLARQCGAAGLEIESEHLLAHAAAASVRGKARRQIPVYRAAAAILGYARAARLARWAAWIQFSRTGSGGDAA